MHFLKEISDLRQNTIQEHVHNAYAAKYVVDKK